MSTNKSPGALNGLRVIDAGQMIAGPLSCTMLADFGAEVIKIEHPVHGDAMRSRPPEKEGKSLWWKVIGRNKKNITLNLSKSEGQALLKRLVKTADVLVENVLGFLRTESGFLGKFAGVATGDNICQTDNRFRHTNNTLEC